MGLFWWRFAWHLMISCRRVTRRGLVGVLLVTLVVLVGGTSGGGSSALDAQEYSVYSDPEKPVFSVLLAEPQNVEEFKAHFGLTDAEVEGVLAAVREENESLAQEYGESEQIVASNNPLAYDEIASKIAASDYDETITAVVTQTKTDVEAILPEDRSVDLGSWINDQWRQEVQEASTEGSAELVRTASGSRALRCRVFATQYSGYTKYEAALPHRKLKFGSQPRVKIRRASGGRVVRPKVEEVGPWNNHDNYWASRKHRTMWKDLPRCTPEAQAAYYDNYNRGKDEYGRKVLNPAGVDLTPAVARGMGLKKYQNAWVYVRLP